MQPPADNAPNAAIINHHMPVIGKVWLTTTHASTAAMLKDNERFSMRSDKSGRIAGIQWWMPRSLRLLAKNMLTSDDPDHRRLRQLVDQAFQRRAVQGMRPEITQIANRLLSEIEQNDSTSDGSFDVQTDYARRLPLEVIAELLGLPAHYRDAFRVHAERLSGVTGLFDFLKMLLPLKRMVALLQQIIDEYRSGDVQQSGLISELLALQTQNTGSADHQISDNELLAMVFLLLMAGHETTTHAITTSIHALETHPVQKALFLKADSPASAVEELLRFNSPVQYSKPRHVRTGGDFFGVRIKQGDLIMADLAQANRDPLVFEKPDELDLTRKPNPHLEFGTGVHFCLGFQLARLEIDVALRALYGRFPNLKISGEPKWRTAFGWRALDELKLETGL